MNSNCAAGATVRAADAVFVHTGLDSSLRDVQDVPDRLLEAVGEQFAAQGVDFFFGGAAFGEVFRGTDGGDVVEFLDKRVGVAGIGFVESDSRRMEAAFGAGERSAFVHMAADAVGVAVQHLGREVLVIDQPRHRRGHSCVEHRSLAVRANEFAHVDISPSDGWLAP